MSDTVEQRERVLALDSEYFTREPGLDGKRRAFLFGRSWRFRFCSTPQRQVNVGSGSAGSSRSAQRESRSWPQPRPRSRRSDRRGAR